MKIAAAQAALITHEVTTNKDKYAVAREALCNTDKYNFAAVAGDIISNLCNNSNLVPSEVVNMPLEEEDNESVLSEKTKRDADELFERLVVSSHEKYDSTLNRIADNIGPVTNDGYDHSVGLDSGPEDDDSDDGNTHLMWKKISANIEKQRQEEAKRCLENKEKQRHSYYKFSCTFAINSKDYHSDFRKHLEEEIQAYLDGNMENGGLVFPEDTVFVSAPDKSEDMSPCWFCNKNFHVDKNDDRKVEVFHEDESGLIKQTEVAVCTPCATRLLASTGHPQAKKGPSIIFKIAGVN